MYYKVEQVLEKQQAVTENFYKGRGILICETDCGLFALKEFRGQNPKAEYLFRLGSYLTEHHISCDFMIKNKEDQLITEGVDGTKYTFHHWMKGRECDAKSRMDLVMTVSFLAGFHSACEREKFWNRASAIGRVDAGRDMKDSMERAANESRGPKELIEEAVQVNQKPEGLQKREVQVNQKLEGLQKKEVQVNQKPEDLQKREVQVNQKPEDLQKREVQKERETGDLKRSVMQVNRDSDLSGAEVIQMIRENRALKLSGEEMLQSDWEPEASTKGVSGLRQGMKPINTPESRTENTSESQTENTLESQTENTPELWMENAPETTYEEYLRRDRELRRIKKYITARKNKSNFELLYLQCFPEYIRQSEEVLQFLSEHQEIFDNHTMGVCHGDFNQHNVVVQSGGMALIHMEHAHDGAQVADLGNFLRKSLEKHAWSETLGLEMLREYDRVHSLNESDWLELYCRMSYPEKFWKIANRYYQSNKVLDSGLNYEKLKKELRQNEARGRFLEVLRRTRVDV